MVAVDIFQCELELFTWDPHDDSRRARGDVCFLQAMLAKMGQVHCSPGPPISFFLDHHLREPRVRLADQYSFQDPFCDICRDICLHLSSEVQWNHCWFLAAIWDCVWFCLDLQWLISCNWSFLSSTLVNAWFLLVFLYSSFQCMNITACGWQWHLGWCVEKSPSRHIRVRVAYPWWLVSGQRYFWCPRFDLGEIIPQILPQSCCSLVSISCLRYMLCFYVPYVVWSIDFKFVSFITLLCNASKFPYSGEICGYDPQILERSVWQEEDVPLDYVHHASVDQSVPRQRWATPDSSIGDPHSSGCWCVRSIQHCCCAV